MKNKKTNRKGRKIVLGVVGAVLLIAVLACTWYINDYYHAEEYVSAYLQSSESVTVTTKDNIVFLDGSGTENALIFYPGAKVEYTAYVPMFFSLAEQGVDCFVVKMPGNLAAFGMNKAEDIVKEYEYENWYLSGHSFGGAIATNFLAEHAEDFDGLILLASYAMKEVPEGLSVLSVYGSEDKVLNMENFIAGRELMPEDYTELCIEGGNHAWFACYGEQAGDGVASITKKEQQKQTIDAILTMIQKSVEKTMNLE